MSIIKLTCDHGWFTDDERAVAAAFIRDFVGVFGRCGVDTTATLKIRTDDVIVSYLHVCRIEAKLGVSVMADGEGTAAPTVDEERVIDVAGRARELLRKAMKDREDYCTRAGAPINRGIASLMKPILKKAEGVMEEALAFEERKRRKRSKS